MDVADDSGVRFKDIGGLEEAKEELQEIITYFRNPQIFWKQGAQIPKGILLVGPPGNGKTLLAKALAGECKLPFIYRSAPEFEKGIVGWGAADIRNTFALARKYAQEKGGCFIFVDEIDAIAGKRHQSIHSHHETLNQLLNELDGFSPRENVIFLAATNSLNTLDPALLRPGRFDRHIYIPLPNFKERQAIIRLYARKKQFTSDVDWKEIAAMTKGMSSAQIANMFNEATILTVRYQQKAISQAILLEAFDRVLMGPALKSQVLTPESKKLVAYHEAGDKEDDILVNKQEILAQIMSLLGGRISEELVFGTSYVTTGNYSDYKRVSVLARDLILRYSMSDLGIIASQDSPFFGEESLNELSETARQKFEDERYGDIIRSLHRDTKKKKVRKREKVRSFLVKIGVVFFAAFFTTAAFTLLLKPNGIYNSGLNGFGREQLGFTLPFYIAIALLAALIHTYGYSLIFKARATPVFEKKNSELEKIISQEENLAIKQEKEKQIRQNQQQIIALQKENSPLTTHLKSKTGSEYLEDYPAEEIEMYLMNKEELKSTLEKEIAKREKEAVSPENKKEKKYLIYLKRRQERTEKEFYEKNPAGYFKGYVKYATNNEKL
ncbi:12942_t:CDS:2 [Entrophospora sp. SA101]|nr:15230_t:CDS:2 [Entrophospora sp. SA101]CAJ0747038.1 12942_t:CDS:2 [Entrophospora sp. SA101]